jgi:ABC-type transporter Mla subunit MlaD
MPSNGRERRRTLLGSMLIAGLLAAAAVIFFLDRLIGAFENRTPIVAVLPNAPGVVPGTPVWIAGERVGRVRRIEFRPARIPPEERVALTLEIPERLRAHLGPGTTVRLTSARMIGERVVDIVPGPAGGAPLAGGDTLRGGELLEVTDIVDRLRVVRAGFEMLADDFSGLAGMPALRDGRMRAVRERFAAVSRELAELRAAAAGGSLARLLGDSALAASVQSLGTRTGQLRVLLGDARRDRTQEADALAAAFRELAADADAVSRDIGRMRALADSAAGTLPRFAADSALTLALRRVQAQLDSLIQEARSNPFRFVF